MNAKQERAVGLKHGMVLANIALARFALTQAISQAFGVIDWNEDWSDKLEEAANMLTALEQKIWQDLK